MTEVKGLPEEMSDLLLQLVKEDAETIADMLEQIVMLMSMEAGKAAVTGGQPDYSQPSRKMAESIATLVSYLFASRRAAYLRIADPVEHNKEVLDGEIMAQGFGNATKALDDRMERTLAALPNDVREEVDKELSKALSARAERRGPIQ